MKYVGYAVVFLFGFFIIWGIGLALNVVSLPFHAASNTVQMGHDVIDKTLNADNAIYNYEWFKQQYQDIQVAKQQYAVAVETENAFKESAGPRSEWTFEDKTEAARLASVTLGLKQQIIQRTEDYNARAKMASRNIFEDGVLPQVLEFGTGFLR